MANKTIVVPVRLDPKMVLHIARIAKKGFTTSASIIRVAIAQYLNRDKINGV